MQAGYVPEYVLMLGGIPSEHHEFSSAQPAAWGRGYGTRATQPVLRCAFDEMSLHRVDLRVLAYHKRAIACYEHCGSCREGMGRQAAWIGGRWHRDIMVSVLEARTEPRVSPTLRIAQASDSRHGSHPYWSRPTARKGRR
ncbi:MAG: GNAT family N-acetyltransferase [Anaerolineae bacterium]